MRLAYFAEIGTTVVTGFAWLTPFVSPSRLRDGLPRFTEFENAHNRYRAERERFDAYSLWEVIQRLKGEVPRYDDGFKVLVLKHAGTRNEGNFEKMARRFQN